MSTSVGFFDHFDEAQKAVQALEDEGIDSGRISLIPEDGEPTKDNDVIPVTGSNVKSHRHIVSVETRSTEEDRIVKEILSGAGAVHLETRGGTMDDDTDDPASRYIKGMDR
jgi:hypothetical protein